MPTTIPLRKENTVNIRGQLNGRKVFIIFCLFFGVIFAVNGVMMYFAVSTFGGIDEAGAYRKNFLLTPDIAAAARQDALGWSVAGQLDRTGTSTARIAVTAKARDGQPLDISWIDVQMRRPANERLDAIVTMQRTGRGHYSGTIANAAAGQWDVVITLRAVNGEMFHSKNRVILK